jgi:hypothetical protein
MNRLETGNCESVEGNRALVAAALMMAFFTACSTPPKEEIGELQGQIAAIEAKLRGKGPEDVIGGFRTELAGLYHETGKLYLEVADDAYSTEPVGANIKYIEQAVKRYEEAIKISECPGMDLCHEFNADRKKALWRLSVAIGDYKRSLKARIRFADDRVKKNDTPGNTKALNDVKKKLLDLLRLELELGAKSKYGGWDEKEEDLRREISSLEVELGESAVAAAPEPVVTPVLDASVDAASEPKVEEVVEVKPGPEPVPRPKPEALPPATNTPAVLVPDVEEKVKLVDRFAQLRRLTLAPNLIGHSQARQLYRNDAELRQHVSDRSAKKKKAIGDPLLVSWKSEHGKSMKDPQQLRELSLEALAEGRWYVELIGAHGYFSAFDQAVALKRAEEL